MMEKKRMIKKKIIKVIMKKKMNMDKEKNEIRLD